MDKKTGQWLEQSDYDMDTAEYMLTGGRSRGDQMDKESALKTIRRFKDIIERKNVKVSKIILFGSYARGDYREDSDIDVIVISDDFAPMDYWERIDFLSETIYELFEPIEATSFTTKEWEASDSFLVDYAREGEVVFAP